MDITIDNILSEWSARVGRIGQGAIPAWKRILSDREVIRDYILAMDAVKQVSAEVERGQHNKTPGLTHFEKAYRSLIAKFERERYEDDKPKGCDSCRDSGLIAVVMAWSRKDERYKPCKYGQTPYCDHKAYRCYIPCTCSKGRGINLAGPNYSMNILQRLNESCAYESNYQADLHMEACIAVQDPEKSHNTGD